MKTPHRFYFCTTGLGSGGAETMLTQLVTGLVRRGHACGVASLAAGGKHLAPLRAAGASVIDLGMRSGRPSLRALLRLRQDASTFRPDLLVGWMYHGNLAASLIQRRMGHRPAMVWNIRQSLYRLQDEKRGSAFVIRCLAHASNRRPQRILYNSALSARQHEALGFDADKTDLVPNGFDTELFRPDPEARHLLLRELKLPQEVVLIGRIGRNAAMKDHPTALAACAGICRNHPEVHVLFAGTGMTDDDPVFRDFLSRQTGIAGQIHFLSERQDLPQLTAALDIVLSSSAFGEGFPNVVGEAMACGVPVVATDVGDTAQVLGQAGRIVPPRDPRRLAAALEEMLSLTTDQRQSLGSVGRQRIVAEFSLESVVPRYEERFIQAMVLAPVS
ncbi:MAG: glycosyltransferase [Verrucomicrobiales bacterium]|nr:glycosyltransferase [Verrucomicrobiales bacterium]